MGTTAKKQHWMHLSELGSTWGLRFTEWVYHHLGSRLTAWLVQGVAAYFFMVRSGGRRSSYAYLKNMKAFSPESLSFERDPSWMDVFNHHREFGITTLERFDIWRGKQERYRFYHHGQEALLELAGRKQGGLFLGAHLGSFDVLRALSVDYHLKVNVLWFRGNSRKFTGVLERLAPAAKLHVVEYEPGRLDAVFALRDAVARGEFIAVMGDRISQAAAGRERSLRVPFLGKPAFFPSGPWILAAALECPVFLTAGIRTDSKTYHLHAVPLAELVQLPRSRREDALREYMGRYAGQMETLCRKFPFQWFNFYDFWGDNGQT